MNNGINWVGNRVLDPNAAACRSTTYAAGTAQSASRRENGAGLGPGTASQASGAQGWAAAAGAQTMTGTQGLPAAAGMASLQQNAGAAGLARPAQNGGTPITISEGPPPVAEKGYIPYYLATHIGKNVRAEFIIGTNQYFDKVGIINEVGINYFVLHDVCSGNYVMCDLYSVKFVTFLPSLDATV